MLAHPCYVCRCQHNAHTCTRACVHAFCSRWSSEEADVFPEALLRLSQGVGQPVGERKRGAQSAFALRIADLVAETSLPRDQLFTKAASLLRKFKESNPGSVVDIAISDAGVVENLTWSAGEALHPLLSNNCLKALHVDGAHTGPACGHRTTVMQMQVLI